MPDTDKADYRNTVKVTSLFGGIQVINIIIQIVRSKLIAVLLGTIGMGISGLLLSTTNLISNLTQFGLGASAVKNISVANGTRDASRLAVVVKVFRRLVWISGSLGTLVMLIFSSQLSELTFGNKNYTIAFIWISITLLFNQLTTGQRVLLQGTRRLQYLAKANLYGNIVGLLLTIPLYFFFGIDGIVPGIIVTSVIALFFSWNYSRKIKLEPVAITKKQMVFEGKDMLKMGILIVMGEILNVLSGYIIRVFINHTAGEAGVDQVGLYNAAFIIINSYVGMIFTAMAADYYPRLSAIAHDNKLCAQTINHQAEIAILLLAPILIVFIVFIKWIIILFYSSKFIGIEGMLYWSALGMFFKAATWCLGFIFLSKGAGKLFFINEIFSNVYMLSLSVLGYYRWGLTGLGIAFLISYLLSFIQVFLISWKKYNFSFDKKFIKLFVIQFVLLLLCFFAINKLSTLYTYIIGSILFLISAAYSLFELNKRLDIKELLSRFKRPRQNH